MKVAFSWICEDIFVLQYSNAFLPDKLKPFPHKDVFVPRDVLGHQCAKCAPEFYILKIYCQCSINID